jgi:hypothetical protein
MGLPPQILPDAVEVGADAISPDAGAAGCRVSKMRLPLPHSEFPAGGFGDVGAVWGGAGLTLMVTS